MLRTRSHRSAVKAAILLAIGSCQVVARLTPHAPPSLINFAGALNASPAPAVFVQWHGRTWDYDPYAQRIYLDYTNDRGELETVRVDARFGERLSSLFRIRSVYTRTLMFAPMFGASPDYRQVVQAMVRNLLSPAELRRLGLPAVDGGPVRVRYEPLLPELDTGPLPRLVVVPRS